MRPRTIALLLVVMVLLLVAVPMAAMGQTEQQGNLILKQGQELYKKARSKQDQEMALKKFEEALAIFDQVRSERGKGVTLNNIAGVYRNWGQYQKAL